MKYVVNKTIGCIFIELFEYFILGDIIKASNSLLYNEYQIFQTKILNGRWILKIWLKYLKLQVGINGTKINQNLRLSKTFFAQRNVKVYNCMCCFNYEIKPRLRNLSLIKFTQVKACIAVMQFSKIEQLHFVIQCVKTMSHRNCWYYI